MCIAILRFAESVLMLAHLKTDFIKLNEKTTMNQSLGTQYNNGFR